MWTDAGNCRHLRSKIRLRRMCDAAEALKKKITITERNKTSQVEILQDSYYGS